MPISTMKKTTDERGDLWRDIFTALGLSTGAAVALGLSRFAYGLLLPPMQADLQWTYVEAGALNTANGAGYIFGALVAAWLARRWGTARAFLAGFSVSVLVLLLTAMTASLSALILLRTVGGVSTAITFILGAGLVSAICPLENPLRRGALVGVIADRGLRVWPDHRPDPGRRHIRCDGQHRSRLLGISVTIGYCRLCESVATSPCTG